MTASPHDIRSVDRLIATLERGNLVAELNDELHKIIEEIENHYQAFRGSPKAELKITLHFQRKGTNTKQAMPPLAVRASFATKLPAAVREEDLLFATPDNFLSKKDHSQPDLPLRDIASDTQTARDVG